MNEKYSRSLHAPISLGTTSDDRFMPKGYLESFIKKEGLILTEKLDGQNNCFKSSGVFARSHVAPTNHPWDVAMRTRWELIKGDLGNIELFGENMYGVHTIEYSKLESYFYLFGVRENDKWLSWEEVEFYAELFDFPTVPVIEQNISLSRISSKIGRLMTENELLEFWLENCLGMDWETYTDTSGNLGGFEPITGKSASEGFVIRNKEGFYTNNGDLPVQPNEFDNLFKLVREKHVKTDTHWTKTWKSAKLIDYSKYGWDSHGYLSNV